MIALAYGCRCHIAMPDDAAQEKGLMLEALGECLLQSSLPNLVQTCVTELQQSSLRAISHHCPVQELLEASCNASSVYGVELLACLLHCAQLNSAAVSELCCCSTARPV